MNKSQEQQQPPNIGKTSAVSTASWWTRFHSHSWPSHLLPFKPSMASLVRASVAQAHKYTALQPIQWWSA